MRNKDFVHALNLARWIKNTEGSLKPLYDPVYESFHEFSRYHNKMTWKEWVTTLVIDLCRVVNFDYNGYPWLRGLGESLFH